MGQLRFVDDEATLRRRRGRARRGLDASLTAMAAGGMREPIDEAFVALARIAADELDAATADPDESRFVRGRLVANALTAYGALFDRGAGDHHASDLEDLFAAARDAEDAGR